MMNKSRKNIVVIFSIILTFTSVPMFSFAGDNANGKVLEIQNNANYVKDEVLVVYKDGISNSKIEDYLDDVDINGASTKTINNEKYSVVELNKDDSVKGTMLDLADSNIVDYVQPNYIYTSSDMNLDAKSNDSVENLIDTTTDASDLINDRYGYLLSYFNDIDISKAINLAKTRTLSKARVAVIDTGVNLNHEDSQVCINKDLSVNAAINPNVSLSVFPSNLLNDTYKYIWNGDIDINNGHGSNVCGIIGATSNNNVGAAGIASAITNNNVDVVGINAFAYYDKCGNLVKDPSAGTMGASSSSVVAALKYAESIKANVINMSLGNYENDVLEMTAINSCVDNNITVVSAAGNDNKTDVHYPSDYENVISVIATEYNESTGMYNRASYSNYGEKKDICAPGTNIIGPSAKDSSTYTAGSGTSQACPIVSSIAAVLYSISSEITVDNVKDILYTTAKDIYEPGKDIESGYGIVDAGNALEKGFSMFPIKTPQIPDQPDEPTVPDEPDEPTVPDEPDVPGDIVSAPTLNLSSKSISSITMKWNKVNKADGYSIYRYDPSTKQYRLINNVGSNTLIYTDNNLNQSTMYRYKIKAFKGNNKSQFSNTLSITTSTNNSKSNISQMELYGNYSRIRVKWQKVTNSDGYQLRIKRSSSLKPAYYTINNKNTCYKIFNTKYSGTKYYASIRTYKVINNKKYYSPWSSSKSVYTLKKITASIFKYKNNRVKVKWKNIYGESGYEIYNRTSTTKWHKLTKISYKYSSIITPRLKKHTTHYFKIRAYKYVNGKYIYGPFSNIKYIKK